MFTAFMGLPPDDYLAGGGSTPLSGKGFFSGRIWRFDERAPDVTPAERHWRQMFLPYGVSSNRARPVISQYGSRMYVTGGYTDNIMVDEHERVVRLGMAAPSAPPIITGASGAGTIAYMSFWDELTEEYGPLSGGAEIGDGTPRTWTNLPLYEPNAYAHPFGWMDVQADRILPTMDAGGTIPNGLSDIFYLRPGDKVYDPDGYTVALLQYPRDYDTWMAYPYVYGVVTGPNGKPTQRASHVCLWLSVAGGLPRLAGKVRLGVESAIESTTVSALGEAHPGVFDRFPVCTINAVYHDRLLMAGDPNALDTVYLSALGFLERWEGFKFKTRGGEAITALVPTRDYCLVMTDNTTYLLQGYTEDDMTMSPVDNGVGAAGPHSMQVVHGTPYVYNKHGLHMYNGTWHQVLLGGARSFAQHFSFNTWNYKTGYLHHNPVDKTLQLFLGPSKDNTPFYVERLYTPPPPDGTPEIRYETYSWVVGYESVQPQAGGGFSGSQLSTDRYWSFRQECSAFLHSENGGRNEVYHGSDRGVLWVEDPDTAFDGESLILTPTYLFDNAGGFETEGKTLTKFWTHASAENSAWYACAIGGDEWVGLQSFLTASASIGVDDSIMLPWRLWGVPHGRTTYVYRATDRNGFGTEHYAHGLTGSLLPGSGVPPWWTVTSQDWLATPKSVHEHPLPDSVSGRGVCFLYYFNNPLGVVWRGVGGYFVPGPITRPTFYVTSYEAEPL